MAGSRTRVNCLEGSYANRYTTNACLIHYQILCINFQTKVQDGIYVAFKLNSSGIFNETSNPLYLNITWYVDLESNYCKIGIDFVFFIKNQFRFDIFIFIGPIITFQNILIQWKEDINERHLQNASHEEVYITSSTSQVKSIVQIQLLEYIS